MTTIVVELAQSASCVVHPLWLSILSQIMGDRLAIREVVAVAADCLFPI
jgi:hypothetical protein